MLLQVGSLHTHIRVLGAAGTDAPDADRRDMILGKYPVRRVRIPPAFHS